MGKKKLKKIMKKRQCSYIDEFGLEVFIDFNGKERYNPEQLELYNHMREEIRQTYIKDWQTAFCSEPIQLIVMLGNYRFYYDEEDIYNE